MNVLPILSALRRHKAGALLIALQIALTLAIVCNALFIIRTRIERIARPSGLDESHLMMVTNDWIQADSYSAAGKAQLDARIQADLATLRALPDVADAYVSNSMPLAGDSWTGAFALKPAAVLSSPGLARATFFMADSHTLHTLGLKLVSGRNFRADEVRPQGLRDPLQPPVAIISEALAHKLFGHGEAVGRTVYINGASSPSRIIGVVRRLQSSSVSDWVAGFAFSTTLVPVRYLDSEVKYVVRARPGRLQAALKAVPAALYQADRMRVIPDDGVRSFAQIRAAAYRADRGMAIMMAIVSLILLAVTSAGIVGLSSFWVGQRRRQIGIRRALGASRRDILGYFLAENALITGAGLIAGMALAYALNQWLMSQFELPRLSLAYLIAGIAALIALGQGAAFAPALRASRISPVEATRTV